MEQGQRVAHLRLKIWQGLDNRGLILETIVRTFLSLLREKEIMMDSENHDLTSTFWALLGSGLP